jgi:DNA-binding CsgD family transcriptional regulator
MGQRGRPPYPDILTPREQEVLVLLREGLTNEQVASRLGIRFETAKWHVSEILSKLGVESREEAAAWRGEDRPWAPAWARRVSSTARSAWLRHMAPAAAVKATALITAAAALTALLALSAALLIDSSRDRSEAQTSAVGEVSPPAPASPSGTETAAATPRTTPAPTDTTVPVVVPAPSSPPAVPATDPGTATAVPQPPPPTETPAVTATLHPSLWTPGPEWQAITWAEAAEFIATCEVASAAQAHSLVVWLTLKNERKVWAREPSIDEVQRELIAAEPDCGHVQYVTE